MQDEIEVMWSPNKTPVNLTPATPRPDKPLTRKQQAFVQHLVNNPKTSATQAVIATYGTPDKPPTYDSASQIATDNLRKPPILTELAKYSETAENVLIDVMVQSKKEMYKTDRARAVDWANTARSTADSLLDRLHGKATQRVEQSSKVVTISIDLTGVTGASEGIDS